MKKFLLASALIAVLGGQAFANFSWDEFKKDVNFKKDAYVWVEWAQAKKNGGVAFDDSFKNTLADLLAKAGTSKDINADVKNFKRDKDHYVAEPVKKLIALLADYSQSVLFIKHDEAEASVNAFVKAVSDKRTALKRPIYKYSAAAVEKVADDKVAQRLAQNDMILMSILTSPTFENMTDHQDLQKHDAKAYKDAGFSDKERLMHIKGIMGITHEARLNDIKEAKAILKRTDKELKVLEKAGVDVAGYKNRLDAYKDKNDVLSEEDRNAIDAIMVEMRTAAEQHDKKIEDDEKKKKDEHTEASEILEKANVELGVLEKAGINVDALKNKIAPYQLEGKVLSKADHDAIDIIIAEMRTAAEQHDKKAEEKKPDAEKVDVKKAADDAIAGLKEKASYRLEGETQKVSHAQLELFINANVEKTEIDGYFADKKIQVKGGKGKGKGTFKNVKVLSFSEKQAAKLYKVAKEKKNNDMTKVIGDLLNSNKAKEVKKAIDAAYPDAE